MNTIWWIALGVTAFVCYAPLVFFLLTPPRKSQHSAPSPLLSHRQRTHRRVRRALARESITPLGKTRVGIDRR